MTDLRMTEISGPEAPWLLEAAVVGRLVPAQREPTVVRPARHMGEYGCLILRTPTPVHAAAVPPTASYHVDEIRAASGIGRTVTGFRLVHAVES